MSDRQRLPSSCAQPVWTGFRCYAAEWKHGMGNLRRLLVRPGERGST
jgi:hypothetical protein